MKTSLFSLLLVIAAAVAMPLHNASADEVRDVRDIIAPVDLTLDRWQPGTVVRTTVVPNADPRVGGVTTRTVPSVPYGAANPEDFPVPAPCPPPPPGCDPYLPAQPAMAPLAPAAAPVAAPAGPRAPARLTRTRKNPDGSCTPACAQRRDDCCWPLDWCGNRYGCWDITLEFTYSFPTGPDGLLGAPAFGAAVPQYDWGALAYSGLLGGRGAIKRQLSPQKWIEVRGFGTEKKSDSNSGIGVFGFRPPAGPPPVPPTTASNPSIGVLTSEIELMGAELNYIREMDCSGCARWDVLAGARWIRIKETSGAAWATGPIAGGGAAVVTSASENQMIAGQIGAIGHYELSPRFEVQAWLKGIMGNMDRKNTVRGANVFVGGPFTSSTNTDTVTFGVDIDLSLKFRLTPRMALTAGYNLLFLDNVVRAYDAMDFTQAFSGAVQSAQTEGQITVHTFFAGVNFNF